jgi:hypothetical protein
MKPLPFLLLALAAVPAAAQHQHQAAPDAATAQPRGPRPAAGREWTGAPLLLPAMARDGERGGAVLRPLGIEAAAVTVYAADGPPERRKVDYPVAAEGARLQSAAPAVGNYHWVTARQESEAEVRVASTVWYFANPGAAPTALLQQSRHELEIVPQPLPREHSGYRESEKWQFLVRFQGRPLGAQPLTLETEFGSRSRVVTDATGVVTVLFPRDHQPAAPDRQAHGGPRRAKFVLATEREDGDRRYLTAFNYVYSPDADRDRSLGWGIAFGVLGMAAATPLLRRRRNGRTQGESNA